MKRLLLIAALSIVIGCPSEPPPDPEPTPAPPAYPSMMVRPEHRQIILDRLEREPYVTILADIQAKAAELYELDDPDAWSSSINGRNAERAQANALLAWLFDDEAAADTARQGFTFLGTHWETNGTWDVNIRMPHPLMGYVNALDLLRATPWLPDDEAEEAERKLTSITDQFFAWFLLDEGVRAFVLGPSQNNHPIRTAAAIGYVALAFPDHPNADMWARVHHFQQDHGDLKEAVKIKAHRNKRKVKDWLDVRRWHGNCEADTWAKQFGQTFSKQIVVEAATAEE